MLSPCSSAYNAAILMTVRQRFAARIFGAFVATAIALAPIAVADPDGNDVTNGSEGNSSTGGNYGGGIQGSPGGNHGGGIQGSAGEPGSAPNAAGGNGGAGANSAGGDGDANGSMCSDPTVNPSSVGAPVLPCR